ncbi:hypothetical protein EBU02_00285 [bacterium]|nr:hypothetical protein [bacterium]
MRTETHENEQKRILNGKYLASGFRPLGTGKHHSNQLKHSFLKKLTAFVTAETSERVRSTSPMRSGWPAQVDSDNGW